jgi:hypothetical protein
LEEIAGEYRRALNKAVLSATLCSIQQQQQHHSQPQQPQLRQRQQQQHSSMNVLQKHLITELHTGSFRPHTLVA